MEVEADLQRFLDAQAPVYSSVVEELSSGRKRTHWMWFIFPQADGLGESDRAIYYSIRSLEHAIRYGEHPVLGSRLMECTKLVNKLKGRSAVSIFGETDAMKFRSSMTLFSIAYPGAGPYRKALDRFYDGAPDGKSLRIVQGWRR